MGNQASHHADREAYHFLSANLRATLWNSCWLRTLNLPHATSRYLQVETRSRNVRDQAGLEWNCIKEPLDPMPLILRQFRQLKKLAIPNRPGHDNLQSILPPSVQHLCLCLIANDADDVAAGLAFHRVKFGNLRSLGVYSKKGTPWVLSQDTWDALTAKGVEVSGDW